MAATIKDICLKTGLGLATVSKYLNGGNVLEKNRTAIEKAIKDLDFHANAFARGMKTGKSHAVGAVIHDMTNLFATRILRVMSDELKQHGYSMIVSDSRGDAEYEKECTSFLLGKMVDGIVNIPVTSKCDHLIPAISRGIPIVLIDRRVDGVSLDTVIADNHDAAYSATKRFIGAGHENIGILAGPDNIYTSIERLDGYFDALLDAGITSGRMYVADGGFSLKDGYNSTKRLVSTYPELTALFSTNYEMTLGMLIALNELGKSIPDDISVIGFDNMDLCRIVRPSLSIVSQPIDDIAMSAVQLLLRRLKGEDPPAETIVMKTRLIDGGSVKDIAKGS